MSDPRGIAAPVGSGAVHPFLDALHERVLVFDGAFGTWMQGQDLGPDDFGGEALEGCNETARARPAPTSSPRCTTSSSRPASTGRDRHLRRVPARAQRVRARRPDVRDQPPRGRARPRGRVRVLARRRPAPLRDRLDRARAPGCPSLGQITYDDAARRLRAPGRRADRGRRRRAARSRPSTTCSRPRPRSTARAPRCARAGVSMPIPIMVQVTVETTGRMLVGTEIGAALTALEAMQPDVIGMNCATGPVEMTEHLRYLAQHARTFLSALPNAGLPSVVDGHTHYDLTPDDARRGARALRRRVRAQRRRRLLRHDARAPPAGRRAARHRPRAGAARARVRARLLVDLLARAVPAGARVPRDRRAHERERLAEVPRRDARSRLRHAACRWRASR